MFNFENIKKIFNYRGETYKNIVPQDNKNVLDEDSYKNILNGSILRIITTVVGQIILISIAVVVFTKTYSWLYGSNIVSYAISETLKSGLLGYIFTIILLSAVPIASIIFINVTKKQEQTTWPYFILLILVGLETIYSLYRTITYFVWMFSSPILSLLGLACVFFALLANVHVAVGCIDFCYNTNKKNPQASTNQQTSVQPQINQTNNVETPQVTTTTPNETPQPVNNEPINTTNSIDNNQNTI